MLWHGSHYFIFIFSLFMHSRCHFYFLSNLEYNISSIIFLYSPSQSWHPSALTPSPTSPLHPLSPPHSSQSVSIRTSGVGWHSIRLRAPTLTGSMKSPLFFVQRCWTPQDSCSRATPSEQGAAGVMDSYCFVNASLQCLQSSRSISTQVIAM